MICITKIFLSFAEISSNNGNQTGLKITTIPEKKIRNQITIPVLAQLSTFLHRFRFSSKPFPSAKIEYEKPELVFLFSIVKLLGKKKSRGRRGKSGTGFVATYEHIKGGQNCSEKHQFNESFSHQTIKASKHEGK